MCDGSRRKKQNLPDLQLRICRIPKPHQVVGNIAYHCVYLDDDFLKA